MINNKCDDDCLPILIGRTYLKCPDRDVLLDYGTIL